MPPPRAKHAAVTLHDDTVIVFGGFNGEHLNDFWRLRLDGQSTATWEPVISKTPVPTPRSSHTATLLADGTMVIYGGRDDTTVFEHVWHVTFDSQVQATWYHVQTSVAAPAARYGHTAVGFADGDVGVFGGEDEEGTRLNDLWHFSVHGYASAVWREMSDNGNKPTARTNHQGVALQDGTWFIHGGDGDSGHLSDAWHTSNVLDCPIGVGHADS
eukprot:3857457-Amphidinium_carterae.1